MSTFFICTQRAGFIFTVYAVRRHKNARLW